MFSEEDCADRAEHLATEAPVRAWKLHKEILQEKRRRFSSLNSRSSVLEDGNRECIIDSRASFHKEDSEENRRPLCVHDRKWTGPSKGRSQSPHQ